MSQGQLVRIALATCEGRAAGCPSPGLTAGLAPSACRVGLIVLAAAEALGVGCGAPADAGLRDGAVTDGSAGDVDGAVTDGSAGDIDGATVDAPDAASCDPDATVGMAGLLPTRQVIAVLTGSGEVAVPPPPLPVTVSAPFWPLEPWFHPALSIVAPNEQCPRVTRLISLAVGSAETSGAREIRAFLGGERLRLLDPADTAVVEPAHSSGSRISFFKPVFSLEGVRAGTGTLTIGAYDGDRRLLQSVRIPGITVAPPPRPVTTCDFTGVPRPRLWLTPDRLARARSRSPADPPAARFWAAVDRFVDALAVAPDPTSTAFESLVPEPEGYVPALALCYQLSRGTDDPTASACAEAAIALTDRIARDYTSGARRFGDGGGSAIRSALVSLLLAYDWLHDRLAPAQRTAYSSVATAWIDWYHGAGPDESKPYTANYAGYLHALALTVAATAGENADIERLVALLNEKLAWELPVLNQRLCGGDWPEGPERGQLAVQQLQLVNQLLRDAGADHSILFDWVEAVPTWLTYQTFPDFRGLVPFGEVSEGAPHRISPALLAVLSSTTGRGALAARLYAMGLAAPGSEMSDRSPGFTAWEMLFADTSSTGDVSALPLTYLATGTGRWISRSSLTDRDAYQIVAEAMSYSGDGFGHANGDVRMYRGSECLLCPAAHRRRAVRGADGTAAFSTYLVNQLPQGPLARNAGVVSVQTGTDLSAVVLRFGSSYAVGPHDEHAVDADNPLLYAFRQVVHLYPDTLIVRDISFRRHPMDTMYALWHLGSTGERMTLDERSFTVPTASGTLRVDRFTDYPRAGATAPTTFEVDLDGDERPIGTLMTERFLTDGSGLAHGEIPYELLTAHVFSHDARRATAWFQCGNHLDGLSCTIALRGLEPGVSDRCVAFERGGRGGTVTAWDTGDVIECP